MAYEFELTETLDDKFKKLEKRNRVLFMACRKKIMEIVQNPYHYKHLMHVMKIFILNEQIFKSLKVSLALNYSK